MDHSTKYKVQYRGSRDVGSQYTVTLITLPMQWQYSTHTGCPAGPLNPGGPTGPGGPYRGRRWFKLYFFKKLRLGGTGIL